MSDSSFFIADFSDGDFTAKYQQDLYDYWLKVKGERTMPARRDISPHDFVPILPMIMMFDYIPREDDFKIRLMGTGCTALVGDIKDEKVTSLKFYSGAADRLKWCVEHKKPYYLKPILKKSDISHVNYSSIVLPLSEDGKNVNMIILANHFY